MEAMMKLRRCHVYAYSCILTVGWLVATNSDQMRGVQDVECFAAGAHCHFQDFVISDDFLYTLWEPQAERTDVG
jgi:hypothetical protein